MIGWLEHPLVKWFLPVPMLAAVLPFVYLMFRGTWGQLESEALQLRQRLAAEGRIDFRPLVTLTLGAVILTMQEYYGQVSYYAERLAPVVARLVHAERDQQVRIHLLTYAELYARSWWAFTRMAGYLVPFAVWPLVFPTDDVRDLGLRFGGLRQHAWLYALFVVLMVPLMLIVSRQPDFGAYYPIYSSAGRSWADFLIWEAGYLTQFVGLEMFFRGWWIRTTRIFGTGAIFSMIVPYCMVHFGKPYLEACAALIAGVALGSLAIRTRSIWAGVAVHVTIALLMDLLSLQRKGQLPSALTAASPHHFDFRYWGTLIWSAWGIAVAVVLLKALRTYQHRRPAR